VCKPDIEAFYDLSSEVVRINTNLMNQAAWASGKQMSPGRIVILHDGVS
jgi:antiviral helicase SKI2